MAAPQSSDPSVERLLNLIDGHRVTAVIYTTAQLGIADFLLEGSKTAAELARLTQTHDRSLSRLMETLVKLAICAETPDGKFELTRTGNHLAENSERSLKAFVLLEGGLIRGAWNELIESIQTGKTAAELAGRTTQEHFANAAKKSAGLFNEAMASITRMAVSDLLSAYDFSGIGTLMDVGGGLGELLIGILRKYPSMRGIVFDLPLSSERAKNNISDAGLADRCEFVPGDFFESVPQGADAIIMKSIIHDWSDERCLRILQHCRRALAPFARLMLVDKVLPETIEPGPADLFVFLDDLNMLRGAGGCERTPREFRALLEKSGFDMQRVVPTGRYSVIDASAV